MRGQDQEKIRNLTDDDVDALAERLEQRFQQRFLIGVGKGLISWVWDKIVAIALFWLLSHFYQNGIK